MAMGLSNAAQSMQRLVEHVLKDIKSIFVYLDDILVFNEDEESHKATINEVLQRLSDFGLSLSLDKCRFGLKEIQFLGFTVNQQGIRPLQSKLQAIQDIPPPPTQKKLLAFLGAISYYRHCLPPLEIPQPDDICGSKKKVFRKTAAEVLQNLYSAATKKLPTKTVV